MAPKRKPLTDASIGDDFDPQAVEQIRQNLNIPVVSPPTGQPEQTQPTKRLNVEIPDDLHRWLKSYCGREGQSITDTVIQLLEGLRAKNE